MPLSLDLPLPAELAVSYAHLIPPNSKATFESSHLSKGYSCGVVVAAASVRSHTDILFLNHDSSKFRQSSDPCMLFMEEPSQLFEVQTA